MKLMSSGMFVGSNMCLQIQFRFCVVADVLKPTRVTVLRLCTNAAPFAVLNDNACELIIMPSFAKVSLNAKG